MPQSAIDVRGGFEEDELKIAITHCKNAINLGMLSEWLTWYTQGIVQGMKPSKAAWEASFEWDLFLQLYRIPKEK